MKKIKLLGKINQKSSSGKWLWGRTVECKRILIFYKSIYILLCSKFLKKKRKERTLIRVQGIYIIPSQSLTKSTET